MLENDSNEFKKIMDNISFFDVGLDNIVAIDRDNSLWAWGKNTDYYWENKDSNLIIDNYQVSVNTPHKLMDNVYSVCAAYDRFYILTFEGELIEWKSPNNHMGLLENVKYIDASTMTVAAITNDDNLICRGLPNTGRVNEDFFTIAENVAYAAVGHEFIAYIDNENRLYCTGRNMNGLIGNGEKVQRASAPIPDGGYPPDPDRDLSMDYIYPPVKTLEDISYKEIPNLVSN